MKTTLSLAVACAALASTPVILAHDTGSASHDHGPSAVPVTFQVEKKGPVKAPAAQDNSFPLYPTHAAAELTRVYPRRRRVLKKTNSGTTLAQSFHIYLNF